MGVENAFDLHFYKALPVSFAARGNDLVKMYKWVMAVVTVNPQGRFLSQIAPFLFFLFQF